MAEYAAPAGGDSWRSLVLPLGVTLAAQTLVALAVYSAPVMAPVAGPGLGVPAAWIGYYIAIVYLGSMCGSVLAGGMVARHGPIRVSQVALGLCLAGLACSAVSSALPLVALGAFLAGLGYGPITPASSQILVRATPPSFISLTFSLKQTGVPLGGAIAGAVVPTLILAVGWRWAAVAIGLACVAGALLIQPTRKRYDTGLNTSAPLSVRSAFAPLGYVFRDRRLAEMAAVSFIFSGVQMTLVAYLVTFMTESFSMSLVLAGFVMSASQVASVVGRVLWGVVADRLFTRRAMLGLLGAGMGLCAISALAASPAWPLPLLFLFVTAFGTTAVGWNGVFLAEVARLAPPGKTSQATGGCMFFTFLGVVVSPPLYSQVLALGGTYAQAYAIFGVAALLAGAWLLLVRRQ
ncbi:MAG: MFS transporter [Proteobacteria bacterium]|nr:MFS transporter [Pseudomonadota bacterium]